LHLPLLVGLPPVQYRQVAVAPVPAEQNYPTPERPEPPLPWGRLEQLLGPPPVE